MNLILDIAWTHVRARVRQTGFAVAGVATGVGFSVMMAALMQGSQDDFTHRLVNTLAHITVSDERRLPPPQPAEMFYASAEIHGLTPEARRPGIKNPLATMAALEAWVPGAIGPSVKVPSIVRYANQDVAVSLIGIDPRREGTISDLPKQIRGGVTLTALYRATNAILIGDGLSEKIGARIGANITVQTSEGARISAHVVGIFHSGVRSIDDRTAYVLTKTGQILSQQTGLINELRLRLRDPMIAREIAARIENDTSYKSVSWQESNEDLLNTFVIRNIIMFTVVGAILLVASFGTYNIISTITHEKARDIAIMKSLGLSEYTVRSIFVIEALIIGVAGALAGFLLGYLLCRVLGTIQVKIRSHLRPATTGLYLRALCSGRCGCAGVFPDCGLSAGPQSRARRSGRNHPGSNMSAPAQPQARTAAANAATPLMEAHKVTRILPGIVPTTLVQGVDLVIRDNEFVAITGPSGSGKSSLLYLLGLLDLPTSGEVLIRGRATAHMSEQERAATRLSLLGFVFQFHFLLPEFTILDNVILPMRALGTLSAPAMQARARDLLGALGLGDHMTKRPDQLSGGQRQRVAVARALANEPPIILADEPTGSLNSKASEQVFELLRDLVDKQGKTVVAVTHDLGLASRMHRQIELMDGAVVSDQAVSARG